MRPITKGSPTLSDGTLSNKTLSNKTLSNSTRREPTVSVIIPALNAEKYLQHALDSVFKQSVQPAEVIVIDDGSTDGTADIAAAFEGVQVIRQENAGASRARNVGVHHSSGEFLAFLDADDLWEPDKSEAQLAALAENGRCDVIFGMVTQFYSPELPPDPSVMVPDQPMTGHLPGAMLLRRQTFDEVGPFDETEKLGDFIDWFARALDHPLKIDVLPGVVMRRRIHTSNTGRIAKDMRQDYVRAVRRVMHRRREQGT